MQSVIKIEVTQMKLKWSLMELAKYQDQVMKLSGTIDLTNSLKNRKKDLIDATPVEIEGIISVENRDQILVDLMLKATLVLPSTRSLTPVDYELTTSLTELYLAPDFSQDELGETANEIVISLEKDILDLKKPIEDTILASIPMKILSEEELVSGKRPSGKDWELKLEGEDSSESAEESEVPQNSPFSILKDLDLFDEEDK